MEDGRKKHGGLRKGAGRKKGTKNALSILIQKECEILINNLLLNEAIKFKATKQLSLSLDSVNEIKEEYLYVIKNKGIFKIGYTTNWKKRYQAYKTHSGFVELVYLTKQYNCFEIEHQLHNMFKEKRFGEGEWYNLNEKDLFKIIKYCSDRIN